MLLHLQLLPYYWTSKNGTLPEELVLPANPDWFRKSLFDILICWRFHVVLFLTQPLPFFSSLLINTLLCTFFGTLGVFFEDHFEDVHFNCVHILYRSLNLFLVTDTVLVITVLLYFLFFLRAFPSLFLPFPAHPLCNSVHGRVLKKNGDDHDDNKNF